MSRFWRLPLLFALFFLPTACDVLGPGQMRWKTLSAAGFFTCGVAAQDSRVYCWGATPGVLANVNVLHEDSLFPASDVPLRVPGGPQFETISNREGTYCGLGNDGAAYCTGLNGFGAVGDSTFYARRGLGRVAGNLKWRSVRASGYHSCGLTVDGRAYCWGERYHGKLGNGINDLDATPYPTLVLGDREYVSIDVGVGFACALTSEGQAWCWGFHGGVNLGVGSAVTSVAHAEPIEVHGGLTFESLSVGFTHACGVTSAAVGYCWGYNYSGQLGEGSTSHHGVPTRVSGPHRWRSMHAGETFTCGLTSGGALYCWGDNEFGQLGGWGMENSYVPLLVAPAGTYREVAVGGSHACGLRFDGVAECWGRGDWGQLGAGRREIRATAAPVRR